MYSFFRGIIENKEKGRISIDVSGVGYEVYMPENELEKIEINSTQKIFVYLQVREDEMKLFGFLDRKTLEFFKKLISVSGVGPKVAIGIISSITTQDMCVAIAKENVALLKSIPGVGPKMAQKIIFELKDKIVKEQLEQITESEKIVVDNEALNEAITALQVLGYSQKQIKEVIEKIDINGDSVESIIKKVLSYMQK